MNLHELLPIVSGLVLGSLLGLCRPPLRLRVGAFLVVAFGVLATLVSGEFRISWAFLAIDIPLVALAAAAGFASMHAYQRSRRNQGSVDPLS